MQAEGSEIQSEQRISLNFWSSTAVERLRKPILTVFRSWIVDFGRMFNEMSETHRESAGQSYIPDQYRALHPRVFALTRALPDVCYLRKFQSLPCFGRGVVNLYLQHWEAALKFNSALSCTFLRLEFSLNATIHF